MKLLSKKDFLLESENLEIEKEMIHSIKVIGSESGIAQLELLLNYIKENGNTGHSFTISVDPDDSEKKKDFGWDGDGSDRIEEITVEAIEVESEKEVVDEVESEDHVNETIDNDDLKRQEDHIEFLDSRIKLFQTDGGLDHWVEKYKEHKSNAEKTLEQMKKVQEDQIKFEKEFGKK